MDDRTRKAFLTSQPGGRVIQPLPQKKPALPELRPRAKAQPTPQFSMAIPELPPIPGAGAPAPQNIGEPGAPYNQTHLPTSYPKAKLAQQSSPTSYAQPTQASVNQKVSPVTNTTRLQSLINRGADQAASRLLSEQQRKQQVIASAQKKYHTAWQNYYQKYYQNYYMAALQEQEKRFAKQRAAVVDSRENDGVLEQKEVQQRLTNDVISKVEQGAKKIKSKAWFWPVAIAVIVVLIFLFLQFNSVIAAKIAAFITPGSSETQTIIVGSGSNTPTSLEPRVIIPKINVNAPVTYGLTSLDEKTVQTALQNGPVNYPVAGATAVPGQKGNTVILGHSSADVFAPGNYKFIFVQLNRLTQGDLFYLDYGKTRYTYKVAQTKVINPNQVDQLNLGTDKPYATLVTCDPPGTIARRLLVIAEQVSPDPNQAAAEQQSDTKPAATITGKPKTLLESIFGN